MCKIRDSSDYFQITDRHVITDAVEIARNQRHAESEQRNIRSR